MTILSVNTWDRGGGAERAARELHDRWLARGEDSWLAVGSVRTPHERTLLIPNRASRSAAARAMMALADALPRSGAAFRAARLLRGPMAEPTRAWRRARGDEDFDHPGTGRLLELPPRRPDVLHLHNLHGGYFDLRELPRLSAAVPTVATLHDAWMLSGHCSHALGCDRWESGCGNCPALWTHPAVPRDRTRENWQRKQEIYSRSALHIATPSEWLAAQVRRSMLMPAVRALRVIPLGVDVGVFTPGDRSGARRALGLDPARPVVLTFSASLRDRSWRDAEAFRSALRRLSGAAVAAQWIAVGESGPDVRIGDVTIRRVGRVDDDPTLALWYRAADLYVHAARADTFPLMVVESLACGTPVAATRVGGIPEQVRGAGFVPGVRGDAAADAATGVLVPPADGAGLARAIEAFFAIDSAGRAQLGANARADAAARFDMARAAADYLAWMRELAAR